MTPRTYYEIATDLADIAPSQARLLRYFLLQDDMRDLEQIKTDLGLKASNFRVLLDKLRDKGIEIVCVRSSAPDDVNKDVRYLYGVATAKVEDWTTDRRKSVLTAWHRTTKVFERHLFSLGLPDPEIYKILGVMEYVTKTLQDINLNTSVIAQEKAAAETTAARSDNALHTS